MLLIKFKYCLLFFVLFSFNINLISQCQPQNTTVSPACDCGKNRTVEINGKSVYLNKYESYAKMQFVQWEGGYISGRWMFSVGNIKIEFEPESDSFIINSLSSSNYDSIQNLTLGCTGIGPISGQWYHLIYEFYLDYDTLVEGRCSGTGYRIKEICAENDIFHNELRLKTFIKEKDSTHYGCDFLQYMDGLFIDQNTGEQLKIDTKKKTVYYRSVKTKYWIPLIASFDPGFITVQFKEGGYLYRLFYTGNAWLLPGEDFSNQKPQFFKLQK